MSEEYVCAVDIGTASARAGIFDRDGRQLGRAEHPILLNEPLPSFAEHDSEDIWLATCSAVKAAIARAGVDARKVVGLCFDATCSLVIRDKDGNKLPVSSDKDQRWDTISWFDHRALKEADACTATGHEVLNSIGGVMSPEMETPKLMWLKRNRPQVWARMAYGFDLADFLTWRATGSNARSQCTLTCKWAYLPHKGGWQRDFFAAVGVDDLLERTGVPEDATPVGERVGVLTDVAARDLGLTTSCAVASGLIDAYAGMLGAIGAHARAEQLHLALIAGTSSCVMSFADAPQFMPSIWGPYLGVALPGVWASEGGQSATGALLDHMIRLHRQGNQPSVADHMQIVKRVQELREADKRLGAELHVVPDFNGNRSPLADPHARGAIIGLTMDASFDALCVLYWRTCVAIALGVRHILDHFDANGQRVEYLHVTGGHVRNPLLMELYADATGVAVVESEAEDEVLLGGAMAAASAAGWHTTLAQACEVMHRGERLRAPNAANWHDYERDYRVFLAMHRQQRELRELMA